MPRRDQFNSEAEWLAHLRLYFAAKAMQAAISGLAARCEPYSYNECAAMAYVQADAMLAARKEPQ